MTTKEKAVREAAAALHEAIIAARTAGLTVHWPMRADDLPAIAISETGKAAVTIQVDGASLDPEVAAKAATAAQKAVDRTIAKT